MTENHDQHYATPEAVLADLQLSRQEKQCLLAQWAMDLEGKLRAADENMSVQTSDSASDSSGDLLRRVKVAQQILNDR